MHLAVPVAEARRPGDEQQRGVVPGAPVPGVAHPGALRGPGRAAAGAVRGTSARSGRAARSPPAGTGSTDAEPSSRVRRRADVVQLVPHPQHTVVVEGELRSPGSGRLLGARRSTATSRSPSRVDVGQAASAAPSAGPPRSAGAVLGRPDPAGQQRERRRDVDRAVRPGRQPGRRRSGTPVAEVGPPVQHRRARRRRTRRARALTPAERRCSRLPRVGRHPLVAPRVSPETNCFCRMKKTISGGSATTIDAGGDQVVVGEELAAQVVQRAGDRELVAALQQHGGPEELVVDPGHLEGRQRGQRRPAQRQGSWKNCRSTEAPSTCGRLVQLLGQRLHVVAQDERAEAGLERRVDQDQRPEAVEQRAGVAHDGRAAGSRGTSGTAGSAAPAGAAGWRPGRQPSRVRLNLN